MGSAIGFRKRPSGGGAFCDDPSDAGTGYNELLADVPLAQTLLMKFQNLGAVNHNLRPANRLALRPRPVQACLDTFRQATRSCLAMVARIDSTASRNGSILRRYSSLKDHQSIALQMLEDLQDALSGETVQRPEQNQVELAFGGIPEQLLEQGAVGILAARLIDVRPGEHPALGSLVRDELAQFPKLILGVLALVGCRHPGIYGNSAH